MLFKSSMLLVRFISSVLVYNECHTTLLSFENQTNHLASIILTQIPMNKSCKWYIRNEDSRNDSGIIIPRQKLLYVFLLKNFNSTTKLKPYLNHSIIRSNSKCIFIFMKKMEEPQINSFLLKIQFLNKVAVVFLQPKFVICNFNSWENQPHQLKIIYDTKHNSNDDLKTIGKQIFYDKIKNFYGKQIKLLLWFHFGQVFRKPYLNGTDILISPGGAEFYIFQEIARTINATLKLKIPDSAELYKMPDSVYREFTESVKQSKFVALKQLPPIPYEPLRKAEDVE